MPAASDASNEYQCTRLPGIIVFLGVMEMISQLLQPTHEHTADASECSANLVVCICKLPCSARRAGLLCLPQDVPKLAGGDDQVAVKGAVGAAELGPLRLVLLGGAGHDAHLKRGTCLAGEAE